MDAAGMQRVIQLRCNIVEEMHIQYCGTQRNLCMRTALFLFITDFGSF